MKVPRSPRATAPCAQISFFSLLPAHFALPILRSFFPELRGCLPIRAVLQVLGGDDVRRLPTEPGANLIRHCQALMATAKVNLCFSEKAVDALANISAVINASAQNPGARRSHTVLERVCEDISFTAAGRSGEAIELDGDFVERNLGALARDADVSRSFLRRNAEDAHTKHHRRHARALRDLAD